MSKYEVYVTANDLPREMFKLRVEGISELIDEINKRYLNIQECSACRVNESGKREYKYFNISEGKVIS